jgi:hypothetical protein
MTSSRSLVGPSAILSRQQIRHVTNKYYLPATITAADKTMIVKEFLASSLSAAPH